MGAQTTFVSRSCQYCLLAVAGIFVYCLGVFYGSSGGLSALSAGRSVKMVSQAMLPVQPTVPDPLTSGCSWDIVYHMWTNLSSNVGSCAEDNPFVDCCSDEQCTGFLRHSSQQGQCYRFAEIPEQLLAKVWVSRPVELLDSALPSKWSFYLKRPIKKLSSSSPSPSLSNSSASGARGVEQQFNGQQKKQTRPDDEIHVVCTVDCRPFNLWQSELLFYSALVAEQPGPITAIISGCSESLIASLQERHKLLAWPTRFTQHFVQTFNDARSMWLSKPFGFHQWYSKSGPERAIVALVDPDFIHGARWRLFLRPLTAELDTRTAPRDWDGPVPSRVQKGHVFAQRYGNVMPNLGSGLYELKFKGHNMSEGDFLSWVCSGDKDGDTGCRGLTLYEMGTFHSSGVPYIPTRTTGTGLRSSGPASPHGCTSTRRRVTTLICSAGVWPTLTNAAGSSSRRRAQEGSETGHAFSEGSGAHRKPSGLLRSPLSPREASQKAGGRLRLRN
ncbi:unnamed protein product [Prorocentrum cordatum]|uniref:Uncharacterized protein n=1 Tax=Prorocentrum cordatum TaxID=2364126 RepID=A0ABN9UDD9_9DINO|nr:unnamed protein product [Polarella glacialis]